MCRNCLVKATQKKKKKKKRGELYPVHEYIHKHIRTHVMLPLIVRYVAAVIRGATARQVEVMIMGRSYFCSSTLLTSLSSLSLSVSCSHIFSSSETTRLRSGRDWSVPTMHVPTRASLSPQPPPSLLLPIPESSHASHLSTVSLNRVFAVVCR